MTRLELSNTHLRATVLPTHGAIFERLDAFVDGEWHPVFEPARFEDTPDPTKSACFTMLPWCNRLSAGGVFGRDGFHAISANWPTTPMPVHGIGWLNPWGIVSQTAQKAVFFQEERGPGPYQFTASLTICLEETQLVMRVDVTNTSGLHLPFGIGFHPYFPRQVGSKITLSCEKYTTFNEAGLPLQKGIVAKELGLYEGMEIPSGAVNLLFEDVREFEVHQPDGGLHTAVHLSPNLQYQQLWAPENSSFFCLEPLSHEVDAFSNQVSAAKHILAPNQTLSAEMCVGPCRPHKRLGAAHPR